METVKTFTNEYGTAQGYFIKRDIIKHGDYKAPEGYSPNAWRGSNCPKDRFLPVKEVAGKIREYIKKDKDLNACKWSVTCESYSGGQSLTVALMAAPFEVFSEEWKQQHPYEIEKGYTQHGDCESAVTPEAFRIISKVKAFALSYNYNDSDSMTDYYDRGFYDFYHVGKWDKPFVRIQDPGRKTGRTTEPNAQSKGNTGSKGLQLVDYSEKAVAIIGDTREIKKSLQELGGRFNPRLTCGAGWIFSKKRLNDLQALIGA